MTGFISPVYSYSTSATSAWTSSTYNQIMPQNTLAAGHTYKLQIRIIKTGTDQSTSSYDLPMELGWPSYGTHPDLTGITNYYASSTRGIKVRLQTTSSSSSSVTPGLEMTLADTSMQGAIVTVTIIPLM